MSEEKNPWDDVYSPDQVSADLEASQAREQRLADTIKKLTNAVYNLGYPEGGQEGLGLLQLTAEEADELLAEYESTRGEQG